MTFPLPLARPLARSPARPRRPQRVGKYIRQLRELIPQDQVDSSRIKVSNQKRAGGSASSSKMAGAASPADEPAPDLSDFADELRETGAKMTVAQLKSALKLMGEKTSGKKDELLERVVAWLEERGLWAEEAGPSKGGKGGKKVEGSDEEMGFGDDGDDEEQEAKPHHHKKKKKRVVVDDEDDG